MTEALRRIQACKESRATILDLGNCGLTDDNIPDELWELECLEELNLGNWRYYNFETKSWEAYDHKIYRNQLTKIPSFPITFSSLLFLDIGHNQIQKIEGLGNLSNLTTLELSGNQIQKIENLENLSSLKRLNLGLNQIQKIENLENLDLLTSLGLYSNKIHKIQNLDTLQNLKGLLLRRNQIEKIENLVGLISLERLDLRLNQIYKLENLDVLSDLKHFYLSKNKVEKVENLEKCKNLTSLYINNNRITKVKSLENLDYLVDIDLSHNNLNTIEGLENFINNQNSHTLLVNSNPIYEIPNEVYSGALLYHNCLPDLRAWQAALSKGKAANKSIKIILCGNSNVGKSCVLDALQDRAYQKGKDTTHAIEIEKVALEDVEAYVWDMGGQEVYHGTHRLFMQSEAIYVLVWDAKTEHQSSAPDRANAAYDNRNYKVPYWIDVIRAVSPESPILLVQNKIDRDDEQPSYQRTLVQDNVAISVAKNTNIEALRHKISYLAKHTPILRYGMEVPSSWWSLRAHILDYLEQRGKNKSLAPSIRVADFEAICAQYEVMEKTTAALLRLLHRSGIVFYQEKNFGGNIILDQTWAIEAIYEILDRTSTFFQQLHSRQFFYQSELFAQWSNEQYTAADKALLLDFMQQADLCFQISEYNDKENPKFIIPRLLSKQQPKTVARIWKNIQDDICYLRYHHQHLHYGIMQQFLIKMGRKTALDMIWQNGIAFAKGDSEALVVANFEQNQIDIQTYGTQAIQLMEAIRKEFWEIYGQKEVAVSVSKDGHQYLKKETLESFQQYDTGKQYTDLFWVLQLPNRERTWDLEGLPDVEQDVKQLQSLNAYISCSDSALDEAYKEEIMKRFKSLKRQYGFSVWDKQQISPGEDITDAIRKELRTADLILLLISPDFTADDFIWEEELKIALERHQNKEATIIPIILRPYDIDDLAGIKHIQALPKDRKAISTFEDTDKALLQVKQGIRRILKNRIG